MRHFRTLLSSICAVGTIGLPCVGQDASAAPANAADAYRALCERFAAVFDDNTDEARSLVDALDLALEVEDDSEREAAWKDLLTPTVGFVDEFLGAAAMPRCAFFHRGDEAHAVVGEHLWVTIRLGGIVEAHGRFGEGGAARGVTLVRGLFASARQFAAQPSTMCQIVALEYEAAAIRLGEVVVGRKDLGDAERVKLIGVAVRHQRVRSGSGARFALMREETDRLVDSVLREQASPEPFSREVRTALSRDLDAYFGPWMTLKPGDDLDELRAASRERVDGWLQQVRTVRREDPTKIESVPALLARAAACALVPNLHEIQVSFEEKSKALGELVRRLEASAAGVNQAGR